MKLKQVGVLLIILMLLFVYPALPDFESSRHLKTDEAKEDFELPIKDTDNDGMPDGWEILYGLNPYDGTDAKEDLDNDGFDYNDNGIIEKSEKFTNLDEYKNNTDPTNDDSDDDGMTDGWEVFFGLDPLEQDDTGDLDNDGLENIYEFANPDYLFVLENEYNQYLKEGNIDNELKDAFQAKDFPITNFDAEISKIDNNNWVIFDGNKKYFIKILDNQTLVSPEKSLDTDGIKTTNPIIPDTDGDGLEDGEEVYKRKDKFLTDPTNSDTDQDGMPDGWEVEVKLNPTKNDALEDPDEDGFDFDGDEIINETERFTNLEEYIANTNPKNNDTDYDFIDDGWEVYYDFNPLIKNSDEDEDLDGYDFDLNGIIDQKEKFTNLEEFLAKTNPRNKDTDNDGIEDGWEVNYNLDPHNPLDAYIDSDEDGFDENRDGKIDTEEKFNNTEEYRYNNKKGTNPINRDTDNDGMPDGWEVFRFLNPTINDADEDPDNDTLINILEYDNPNDDTDDIDDSDPMFNDTDDDGAFDGIEAIIHGTDPTNKDTDGDDMEDGWEIKYDLDPLNELDIYDNPDNDGYSISLLRNHNGTQIILFLDLEENNSFNFTNIEEWNWTKRNRLEGKEANPMSNDTDKDGISDGWEWAHELKWFETRPEYTLDLDDPSDANYDPDHDGLKNKYEFKNPYDNDDNITTSLSIPDTDGDWSSDGEEIFGNKYGFITDPTNWDTDNDSMSDGWEAIFSKWDDNLKIFMPNPTNGTDANVDPDNDSFDSNSNGTIEKDESYSNYLEYLYWSNPNNNDTDEDGMPDGWEYYNKLVPTFNDSYYDNDNDGFDFNNDWKIDEIEAYTNLEEYLNETDPGNNDSDEDGIFDGWEVQFGLNPNSDDSLEDPDNDKLSNILEFLNPENVNYDDIDWTFPNLNDSDRDNVLDGYEIENGTDPTTNDTDSDGMPDDWEIKYIDKLDPTVNDSAEDPDKDDLINSEEYENPINYDDNNSTDPTKKDTDNDGIEDGEEVIDGEDGFITDPTMFDTDKDGLPDGWEVEYNFYPTPDNDNSSDNPDNDDLDNIDEYLNSFDVDGITSSDPRNNDTDGDGILDGTEIHGTNGFITDPTCLDSDFDGLYDGWEVENGFDPTINDASLDPDNDNLNNYEEFLNNSDPHNNDTDYDGILDGEEANWTGGEDGYVTNATNNDTDGDKLPDGWEIDYGFNPTISDSNLDPDNDGLTNFNEYINPIDFDGVNFTDPWNEDTDGDGLKDGAEIFVHGIDPTTNDTDRDGMQDGWEVNYDLDPNNVIDADLDKDNDGFDFDGNGTIWGEEKYTNLEEYKNGTNPTNNDTDNDGIIDGWEIWYGLNPNVLDDANEDFDDDGFNKSVNFTNLQEFLNNTNPINNDTDNDQMLDGWEVFYNLNPIDPNDANSDKDNDGFDFDKNGTIWRDEKYTNLEEFNNGTNPINNDTDIDGIIDGWEIWYNLNPNDPIDADLDNDNDGYDFDNNKIINQTEKFTNLEEFLNKTNPNNNDTDNDEMIDGWEVGYSLNPNYPDDANDDNDTDGFDFDNNKIINQTEKFTNLEEFINGTKPNNIDTDEDGMIDGWEYWFGLNPNDLNDALWDLDNDGFDFNGDDDVNENERFTNLEEFLNMTNPKNNDTDNDGMIDGWEVGYELNPNYPGDANDDNDTDGFDFDRNGNINQTEKYTNLEEYKIDTNPKNDDTDNDEIIDGWENWYGLNPNDENDAIQDLDNDGFDFDNDTFIDQAEKYTNIEEFVENTNPNKKDTDEDGMIDGWEVGYFLNPIYSQDANEDNDTDGFDFDRNGTIWGNEKYTNLEEYQKGTNPTDNDTDNDGIIDGWEYWFGLNPNNDNDAIQDFDNDGYDFDNNGEIDENEIFTNLEEFLNKTNPNSNDTDNDKMLDGWEIHYNLDPNNSSDADIDSDNDSYDANGNGKIDEDEKFTNLREFEYGTDPKDEDTDDDGMKDGWEWYYEK